MAELRKPLFTWRFSAPVPIVPRPVRSPKPPLADTPDARVLRSALGAIPNAGTNSVDYDTWFKIACAVHYATDGSDDGLNIFREWSFRSEKHDDSFLEGRVWPYIKTERGGEVITERSLFRMAAQHGWADPTLADDFEVLEGDEPGEAATPKLPAPYPVDRADRMPLHLDERDLIGGLLGLEDVAAIVGASGSGKSFLALYAAVCIATGRPFFGRRVEPGPVVMVVYEGRRRFGRRIAALLKHLEHVGSLPLYILHTARPNLRRDADTLRVIETVRFAAASESGQPVRLVVLDTFAQAAPGIDENAAGPVQEAMNRAGLIAQETGAAVAWVHHLGKDPEKGARGSSAFYGALDAELRLTRNAAGVRTVKAAKARDGEDGMVVGAFRLVSVEVGTDPDGAPVRSCAVEPLADAAGLFDREPLKPGSDAARVLDVLKELVAAEGEIPERVENCKFSAVPVERWRETAMSRLVAEGKTQDAAKRAFSRARTFLGTNDYAAETQGWCGFAP